MEGKQAWHWGCGSKNGKFAGSLEPEVNRVGGIPQWLRLFASKMDKTPSQNKIPSQKQTSGTYDTVGVAHDPDLPVYTVDSFVREPIHKVMGDANSRQAHWS